MGDCLGRCRESRKSDQERLFQQGSHSELTIINANLGKISQDYTLLDPPIGSGAYGEVRKAIHKLTGLNRAVKIIHKTARNQEEQQRILNEVNILQKLDHTNIIKNYEFYQNEECLYIVTDLCDGGDLFERIHEECSFSEKKAAELMKQIFQAINYCHKAQIVHRDLKPENLVYDTLDQSQLKVIDFGIAIQIEPHKKLEDLLGTPYFIAPEVLKKSYNEKCDIWSCGVILYIMLCGYPPFQGKTEYQIMDKVSKGTYSFDSLQWDEISKEAKDFISKMLHYEPCKRYSAEECLQDPWLKKWTTSEQVEIPLMTHQKLSDATYKYIVNFISTKEEKAELLRTFQSLDTNNDGKLSRKELLVGYQKIINPVEAADEVERIFKQVDQDNSGAIDYTEFVIATINRQQILSRQRLETTFKLFDKDQSGMISIDELKEKFNGISEDLWKQVIKEVDQNEDGQISLEEFCTMMQKIE